MAWTAEDLARVEALLAGGKRRIQYGDRRIDNMSEEELTNIRNQIREELGLTDRGRILQKVRTLRGLR